MADGPDYKSIGLAGKDILMGLVGVIAGAEAGPEGAKAVNKMDQGIDKALAMGGVTESRADKADRAESKQNRNKQAGPPQASAAEIASSQNKPGEGAAKPAGPPPASAAEVASSQRKPGEAAWPPQGDGRITADHLSGLGYSRENIRTILDGPESTSLAEVTNTRDRRTVDGTRVAQGDAQRLDPAKASASHSVVAEPVATADAKRVADAVPVDSVDAKSIPIVSARRIDTKGGSRTA